MATHSSTLAWKIPWMAELSMGSQSWARLSGFTFTLATCDGDTLLTPLILLSPFLHPLQEADQYLLASGENQ